MCRCACYHGIQIPLLFFFFANFSPFKLAISCEFAGNLDVICYNSFICSLFILFSHNLQHGKYKSLYNR